MRFQKTNIGSSTWCMEIGSNHTGSCTRKTHIHTFSCPPFLPLSFEAFAARTTIWTSLRYIPIHHTDFQSGEWLGQKISPPLMPFCGIDWACWSAGDVRRYAIHYAPISRMHVQSGKSSASSCYVQVEWIFLFSLLLRVCVRKTWRS